MRSHRIVPLRLSMAYVTNRWGDRSSEESPSPYSPGLKVALGFALIAVVTNTRLPQTTGLECPSPGSEVRQRMLSPVFTSQLSGRFCLTATPDACVPRNAGQLPAAAPAAASLEERSPAVRTIRR